MGRSEGRRKRETVLQKTFHTKETGSARPASKTRIRFPATPVSDRPFRTPAQGFFPGQLSHVCPHAHVRVFRGQCESVDFPTDDLALPCCGHWFEENPADSTTSCILPMTGIPVEIKRSNRESVENFPDAGCLPVRPPRSGQSRVSRDIFVLV